MAPSVGAIMRGMAFVAIGLLKALCDRWQLETNAMGRNTSHTFNHLIVLIFMEQLLQMCLLLFYNAMDKNWLGCGIFYHGDLVHRVNPNIVLGQGELNANLDDRGTAINIEEDDMGQVNHAQSDEEEEEEEEEEEYFLDEEPRRRKPSRFLYLIPGFLWVFSTFLVHFGLDLTYGSSFIMLKGTMTLFTALLGIAFLAQQLFCHVWIGILLSCSGFAIAGLADFLKKPQGGYEKYGVASGVLLIMMSQICIAIKLIYEEKYLRKHSIHPMKFLGGEGVFGFLMCGALLVVFCVVPVNDYYNYVIPKTQHLEDIVDTVIQLGNSWRLIVAFVGSLLLHVVWNYLGLLMVRDHGALPRIMIETLVWMFYWVVCLSLQWENFYVGQVPGLCVIAVGLLFYGNILPLFSVCDPRVADINLSRMYLNREHHRYEPLDEQDGEQVQDGDDTSRNRQGEDEGAEAAGGSSGRKPTGASSGLTTQAGSSRAQLAQDGATATESSDDEYDENGRPKDGNGACNRAYNGDSSSDEEKAEDKGTDPIRARQLGGRGTVNFSSGEEEDEDTTRKVEAARSRSRHSNSSDDNHNNDEDDELLSIEPPQQRNDDSSSRSSHDSNGSNHNDDERLLQA
ncbi:hypothetical protein EGW08_021268 [Elysia chlorotica]|uniref:EamA domain-containing protein n=1 Tax=Elysia chlorotica TaxID=188477 RepID=A0A433SP14_ELYCH|nr:hypothetical protein EGW08_021268 [Elysia chlorotica]